MAVQVLYQADVLVDGIAASTEFCKIKFTYDQENKDRTAFQDVARCYVPSLYRASAEGEFYVQTGNAGLLAANKFESATAGVTAGTFTPLVVTLGHDLTVGSIVTIWRAVSASLDETGDDGEILKGMVKTSAADRGVQATRLIRASAAVTGTSGTGTVQQLGAVAAGQSLYSALHVLGTTGGSSGTVFSIISSASSSLGAPTTRVTFVAGTSAQAGEWGTPAAGAITDTWWAFKWTGYTGSGCTVSCSAGIQ